MGGWMDGWADVTDRGDRLWINGGVSGHLGP